MIRTIRRALEAVLILFAFGLFRLMPLDIASAVGAVLARLLGPFVRAHRTARTNIEKAMPELPERQVARILSDMWDNLGRTLGEYPHVGGNAMRKRVAIEGLENIQFAKTGKPVIFVSGHFANWEVLPLSTDIAGVPSVLIYRAANNPLSDWMIRRIRARYSLAMYAKGRSGAQQAITTIKNAKPLAMLVDQKQNDGKAIDFFGRKAMTATAAMQLAIKYQVPVITVRAVRTDGVHFQVTYEAPVTYGPGADPEKAMAALNLLFERWIREYPAQWLWVHRRWGADT